MYYALTDTFAGDNPSEHTAGFANTSAVIAFRTRKQRDEWVKTTKLLTAKAITRKDALKIESWRTGDYYGKRHCDVKVVRVYGETRESSVSWDPEPVYHILASR